MRRHRRSVPGGWRLAGVVALVLGLSGIEPAGAQPTPGHGGPVRALATLADGRVVSGGFDQAIIVWSDAAGDRPATLLRWHAGAVNALLALPGGGFASAGEDGRLALWPAAPGPGPAPGEEPGRGPQPARVLLAGGAALAALALGPAGELAAADWDGVIRRWPPGAAAFGPVDAALADPPQALAGHRGPVLGLAWRTDGVLASTGYDGTLRLWDAAGVGRGLGDFGVPLGALLALPDAGLVAAGADGTLRLLAPDGTLRTLSAGSRPVVALALAPDGRTLAAASLGGSVGLWSLPEGRLRRSLEGPGLPVWSVAFAADGLTITTGGADRLVRRWAAASGAPLGLPEPVEAAGSPAAATEGARVFRACDACHALAETATPMAGPHLAGLFGRRMGGVPGYAYSPRLAAGDLVWGPETLTRLFTEGPEAMLPGTRMPLQRLADPAELDALLRFLAAATR